MIVTPPTDWVEVTPEQFEAAKDLVYNWSRQAYVGAIIYSYSESIGNFAYECDDGRLLVEPGLLKHIEGGAK